MTFTRRRFLGSAAGAAGLLCAPAGFAQSQSARRRFSATRGRSSAGHQQITLSRSGDVVTIDLETRLTVKLLGITVFRYALNSREIWEGGEVQMISGKTDDNGSPAFVEAKRTGAGLDVKGSDYTGVVKGKIATTSFFTTSLLDRKTWVSTQGGKPIKVDVTKKGQVTLPLPGGAILAQHYYIAGGLNIPLDAYYDGNGDLAGYSFDARGERAQVMADSLTPALNPVWT